MSMGLEEDKKLKTKTADQKEENHLLPKEVVTAPSSPLPKSSTPALHVVF